MSKAPRSASLSRGRAEKRSDVGCPINAGVESMIAENRRQYLIAVAIVFVFGPGKISIDTLVAKYLKGADTNKAK